MFRSKQFAHWAPHLIIVVIAIVVVGKFTTRDATALSQNSPLWIGVTAIGAVMFATTLFISGIQRGLRVAFALATVGMLLRLAAQLGVLEDSAPLLILSIVAFVGATVAAVVAARAISKANN